MTNVVGVCYNAFMKKILVVDIDDVLVNNCLLIMLNKFLGTNYKEEDFDTLALAGYRSTLSNLNSKYNQAAMKIQELNSELSSLKKQKKQMGIVVCLTIILFVGSIIFFNTLEMKDRNIEEQAETIELQNTENKALSSEKNKLNDDNIFLIIKNHRTCDFAGPVIFVFIYCFPMRAQQV